MNNIKLTHRSEINYLGDELIVRKAFVKDGEEYDIVVKYQGIQRLGENVPEYLAERIKSIWQQANILWQTRDVTAEFTWDKNRVFVSGKNVRVKQGNHPMKQLHTLIAGLLYQGVPLLKKTISAQPAAAKTAPVATSIHAQPLPATPKSRKRSPSINTPPAQPAVTTASKPEFSPSEPDIRRWPLKTKPCTERRPVVQRPPVRLTDEVAEAAFTSALAKFSPDENYDAPQFFGSLVKPLRELKRSEGLRNNEALQFIKLFAAQIAEISPDQKKLSKFLAVKYLCTHAARYITAAGQTESELLSLLNQ